MRRRQQRAARNGKAGFQSRAGCQQRPRCHQQQPADAGQQRQARLLPLEPLGQREQAGGKGEAQHQQVKGLARIDLRRQHRHQGDQQRQGKTVNHAERRSGYGKAVEPVARAVRRGGGAGRGGGHEGILSYDIISHARSIGPSSRHVKAFS